MGGTFLAEIFIISQPVTPITAYDLANVQTVFLVLKASSQTSFPSANQRYQPVGSKPTIRPTELLTLVCACVTFRDFLSPCVAAGGNLVVKIKVHHRTTGSVLSNLWCEYAPPAFQAGAAPVTGGCVLRINRVRSRWFTFIAICYTGSTLISKRRLLKLLPAGQRVLAIQLINSLTRPKQIPQVGQSCESSKHLSGFSDASSTRAVDTNGN